MIKTQRFRVCKITSGGQTGADRSALDFALLSGIPHDGWCPKGRKAEDGRIPEQYQLKETPSSGYLQRTSWNVRDADATVVFTLNRRLHGGSLRTAEIARRLGKPCLCVSCENDNDTAATLLRQFLHQFAVRILNVAGSRLSKETGIDQFVMRTLAEAIASFEVGKNLQQSGPFH